jgi:hypothetical protein
MKHRLQNLSSVLEQNLNMYALAASAAGVGILALANPAEAKIVYTSAHEYVPPPPGGKLLIDLNHDKIDDFMLSNTFTLNFGALVVCGPKNGSFYNCLNHSGPNQIWGTALPGGRAFASALQSGKQIASNQHFRGRPHSGMKFWSCPQESCSKTLLSGGPWNDVKDRYLGLQFLIKGKVHYGWARLNVGKYRSPALLTGYAYETIPNKPIIAGKTKGADVVTMRPDSAPGSLGRLALGRK